jgi:hypothetical protein
MAGVNQQTEFGEDFQRILSFDASSEQQLPSKYSQWNCQERQNHHRGSDSQNQNQMDLI